MGRACHWTLSASTGAGCAGAGSLSDGCAGHTHALSTHPFPLAEEGGGMGVHLTRVAPVAATFWWVESTHPIAHAFTVLIGAVSYIPRSAGRNSLQDRVCRGLRTPALARCWETKLREQTLPGGAQRGGSPTHSARQLRERSWTGRAGSWGITRTDWRSPPVGHSGRRCFWAEACESWLGGTQKTGKDPSHWRTSPKVWGEGASVVTALDVAASHSRPGSWAVRRQTGF